MQEELAPVTSSILLHDIIQINIILYPLCHVLATFSCSSPDNEFGPKFVFQRRFHEWALSSYSDSGWYPGKIRNNC